MTRRSPSDFGQAASNSFSVVAVLFAITLADLTLRLGLVRFGIVPRTPTGLWGILCSPLIHASFAHVAANGLPLFVLLTLLFTNPSYHPGRTLALIWFGSGLGTWMIGRPDSVHVGASSIIFGLAAFLIVAGVVLRSWRPFFVALFVLIAFGGIFYGVVPRDGPISWEGHLSGAIVGVWTALRTLRPR
jgi:membrane associated rhomboid family serine protease